MTSHQHYNETTLNKMVFFENPLYIKAIKHQIREGARVREEDSEFCHVPFPSRSVF